MILETGKSKIGESVSGFWGGLYAIVPYMAEK
jgi:hypothetical protein